MPMFTQLELLCYGQSGDCIETKTDLKGTLFLFLFRVGYGGGGGGGGGDGGGGGGGAGGKHTKEHCITI